jgi:hypothetical protein
MVYGGHEVGQEHLGSQYSGKRAGDKPWAIHCLVGREASKEATSKLRE